MLDGSKLGLRRHSYPDPFLDIASTRLPKDRRKMLQMCFVFATQHPQIAPIVKKLARYPITHINVDAKTPAAVEHWKDLFENTLDIYHHIEEMGLDYFGYGNAFYVVHRPFIRFYKCQNCGHDNRAGKVHYTIRGNQFHGVCSSCKTHAVLKPRDELLRRAKGMRLVRLMPQNMAIKTAAMSGWVCYDYEPSKDIKQAVARGGKPHRDIIDATPWTYVQAALQKKKVRFGKNNLLHLKEPSLSQPMSLGWGDPITLAGLKDAYLNQIFKKADESAANERSLPVRFVYPAATSQDPMRTISLRRFNLFMERALHGWRRDKNSVITSPFPVAVSEVGGDAARFNTAQQRQLAIKEIIGSTGMPEGFLSDSMSWSGGSVQLRMLENALMPYARAVAKVLDFVRRQVMSYADVPACESVKMKPFRMSDDLQMMQLMVSLAQMNVVSWAEVLERFDLSWDEEHDKIKREARSISEVEGIRQVGQTIAMLKSTGAQVQAESVGSGYQTLLEDQNNTAAAEEQSLREGGMSANEAKVQIEEQKAEAAQEPSTEEVLDKARAQKYEAEANQKGIHAEVTENQSEDIATPSFIDDMARQLQELPREEAEAILVDVSKESPDIAAQIEARLEELDGRSGVGNALEEEASELDQLREESASPEDMANKLLMMPAAKRERVFGMLIQEDQLLAMRVSKFLSQMGGSGGSKVKPVIDMRPSPQQKPPRRS